MIRDHLDNFELTDEILRKHRNEAGALGYLFAGLEFLYQLVMQAETAAKQRFVTEIAEHSGTGTDPAPVGLPPGVAPCAFHWYATTACNWVKMIGWIRKRHDPHAEEPDEYVGKVFPAVKFWRDKVSAHFAVHTPHRKDTPADELASLIPPTAFQNGRIVAGAYQVVVTRAGQTSSSRLLPWSLTEVHEQLRARYGLTGG